MAFPMGLPKHDPVYSALEGEEGLDGTQAQQGSIMLRPVVVRREGICQRELVRDRVGKNEKTKVVAKLQKPGHGTQYDRASPKASARR